MARSRRRRIKLPKEPQQASIDSMSHDGKGIAHIDGKVTFIHGALPGETVMFLKTGKKKNQDEGHVTEILQASEDRIDAKCQHYAVCGGCSLQHISTETQIRYKQQQLLEVMKHLGKVELKNVLPPLLADSSWGYRRKARLGVKYVYKKDKVLVGFRERGTGFLAELSQCEVLHPKVGLLLVPLQEMIFQLSNRDKIPQIEVAIGDDSCVLNFRLLEPLNEADEVIMLDFAQQHSVGIYVQSKGPDTIKPLANSQHTKLGYSLPAYQVTMPYKVNDFTQVNSELNELMVARALALLAIESTDKVLDLFCGLGNFTLPMARLAQEVIGVEGDATLVARARENALHNGITNTRYFTTNLYEALNKEVWFQEKFDKVLLDPPRSGAFEVLAHLAKLGIKRIVYVSCYPATLARDAGELVNNQGYTLISAGVMDMFPHTSHVESIAVFEKQ